MKDGAHILIMMEKGDTTHAGYTLKDFQNVRDHKHEDQIILDVTVFLL